jgi:anti-sigma factor RsiW
VNGERTEGELRCGEVLAALSDYLDGALDARTRAAVEAHVSRCEVCAQLGGTVAASIAALRRGLASRPEDSEQDALARVRARLPGGGVAT